MHESRSDSQSGPRRLGPYLLVRELARGGMGTVWEAEHSETGARRALKTLWLADDVAPDPDLQERFRREAELQARLEHPHVARVHEADFAGRTPYLVQNLLTGGTLWDRLKRDGPLPPPQAAGIAAKLASGLARAHGLGVIHRDLKPQNVLFDDQGEPQLTDFGLAVSLNQGSVRLSMSGEALGTPAYMAPEQAYGHRDVDARTDVYGLGAVLFAMLTGRPPFEGATALEVMQAVITDPAPDLTRHDAHVPPELAAVVARCLAKERDQRFQSMDELERALRAAFAPSEPVRFNARLLGLAAGALGSLLLLLAALTLPRRGAPSPTPTPLSNAAATTPSATPQASPAGLGFRVDEPLRYGVFRLVEVDYQDDAREGYEAVARLGFWLTMIPREVQAHRVRLEVHIDRLGLLFIRESLRVLYDSQTSSRIRAHLQALRRAAGDPEQLALLEARSRELSPAVDVLVLDPLVEEGRTFDLLLDPRSGEVESLLGMDRLLQAVETSVSNDRNSIFEPGDPGLERLLSYFSADAIKDTLQLHLFVVPPHRERDHARRELEPPATRPFECAFAFSEVGPGRYAIEYGPTLQSERMRTEFQGTGQALIRDGRLLGSSYTHTLRAPWGGAHRTVQDALRVASWMRLFSELEWEELLALPRGDLSTWAPDGLPERLALPAE